jgi:hypothetical protein
MLNIWSQASDQWYCWQSVIPLPISTEAYPLPTVSTKSTCYDTCLVRCNESEHQTSCVISGILTKYKCQHFISEHKPIICYYQTPIEKNLTLLGWKMTLVNAKCDTVQAKCHLKLLAKNIRSNQWPFQTCILQSKLNAKFLDQRVKDNTEFRNRTAQSHVQTRAKTSSVSLMQEVPAVCMIKQRQIAVPEMFDYLMHFCSRLLVYSHASLTDGDMFWEMRR